MGTISVKQKESLYWLGRYTERVYTTISQFIGYFDEMIDTDDVESKCKAFCQDLDIPNIYTDPIDFVMRYCYDEENPDSIISNLTRGYGNAMMLREVLGSKTFSYIQMALYNMRNAASSGAPIIDLQKVCDNIVAFWGMMDDSIHADHTPRDLVKIGRRVERVDLYGRMEQPLEIMQPAVRRLTSSYRLIRSGLDCCRERVQDLDAIAAREPMDYRAIVYEVEHLFDVNKPEK